MRIRKTITIILILLIISILTSCQEKINIPDTEVNTCWLAVLATKRGDYDNFNSYFSDGRKNSVSLEEFNEIKELTTAGTSYINYELLQFTNGEMVLVRLTPEKVNGEYKIEDFIKVPDEMKALFKEKE